MGYEYPAYLYLVAFASPGHPSVHIDNRVLTLASKINSEWDIRRIEKWIGGCTMDVSIFNITLLDEWKRDTPVDEGEENGK